MNAITDPRHAAADDEDDVLFARKERVGKYMPAEERAARLVRKLDAFLRKGPRKGLNYQKWQQLAYKEAVDELLRAETARKHHDGMIKAGMLSLGVGLGSIAFWGMVLFMGKMSWLAGGMVFLSGAWIYLALKRCNWMSGPGESEDGDE